MSCRTVFKSEIDLHIMKTGINKSESRIVSEDAKNTLNFRNFLSALEKFNPVAAWQIVLEV